MSPPSSSLYHIPLLVALAGVVGCEALTDQGAIVNVFATHHSSPEDGEFPSRGEAGQPRIFDLEDGRELLLAESFVTISATTLVSCGGREYPLKMFWGPCPEDLRGEDLEVLTVAGAKVDPGEYCELKVEYSPYKTPTIGDDKETRHAIPGTDEVDGNTIYLRGVARTEADPTGTIFELENDESFTVTLDLTGREGPGEPLKVGKEEDFPKELTISKTYDRFFDGIDWDSFDEDAAADELDEILSDQTQVVFGQVVFAADWDDL